MKSYINIFVLLIVYIFSNFVNAEHKRFFAYRSFWPEFKAMENFAKIGVNLYAVMPSNAYNSLGEPYCKYPPVWPWKDVYDWESLNAQFEDIIKINPKARFIFMIDLNSPLWLAKSIDFKMGIGGDSYISLSNSVCTKLWLEPTEDYLKAVVTHAEKKYGDRIEKYMVSAGCTSEWYDRAYGIANLDKIERWHKWRKENKLPPADIPPLQNISKFDFEKRIRDPKIHSLEMEYSRFESDVIIEAMRRFCRIIKDMTKNKEVGVFAGYLPSTPRNRYDVEKTYNNDDIDFFGAPPYYDRTRAVGAAGSPQALLNSAFVAGKGWFQEIDHRTHTFNSQLTKFVRIEDYANAKTQAESSAILKREFSYATIYHSSMWCFDMWGGVFSSDETMEVVKRSYEIWKKFSEDKSEISCDIAIIGDTNSFQYTSRVNMREIYEAMSDAGLPYVAFNFADLNKIDLKKYKLVIFPHTFEITPEREKILREKVFTDNKTVMFIDVFGISDGKSLDISRIEKYTGFPFASDKAILEKNMSSWKSVFIPRNKNIDGKVMREIAKKAGVHFYIKDCDPVFINDRLLCIHTKNGGKKVIALKGKYSKVIELYSNKIIAEDTNNFEYTFQAPDTALFELIK